MKRKLFGICAAIVMVAAMAGCQKQSATSQAQRKIVDQQNVATGRLNVSQPPFFPAFSNELRNINERTARLNDPNLIGYVAVMTQNGGILYNGTVKGKISNVDSQNTPADGLDCEHFGAGDPRPDGCGVVQVAQSDGSWGTNGGGSGTGIFFFDAQGHYHEYQGNLAISYSDSPQTITTPPILTINASAQMSNKCDAQGNNCAGAAPVAVPATTPTTAKK